MQRTQVSDFPLVGTNVAQFELRREEDLARECTASRTGGPSSPKGWPPPNVRLGFTSGAEGPPPSWAESNPAVCLLSTNAFIS
ncbi:MAG: hypothetical protein ACTSR8_01960 [Promethearchaeota archaeon]